MPLYVFRCKKCDHDFEELCKWEEIGGVRCPGCNSKKVEKQLTNAYPTFVNPGDTSKWDNFEYRAGWNMEKAKKERAAAEKAAGGVSPYRLSPDEKD